MAGGPLLVQSFFPSFNGFSLLHRPSPEKLMRSGSNCHVHPIVITSSSSSSSDHSTATSTATATTTSIPASVSPQIPLNAKVNKIASSKPCFHYSSMLIMHDSSSIHYGTMCHIHHVIICAIIHHPCLHGIMQIIDYSSSFITITIRVQI